MITRPSAILNPKTGEIIVQTPMPPITCLALEGGGSRCAAYTGFYKVLKNCGLIDDVIHVSGSSGGSVCALAIALGFESEESEEIMMSLQIEKLLEGQHQLISTSGGWWSLGKTIWSVWRSEKHSLASGNEFLKWIESLVEKKLGHTQATFRDLARRIEDEKSKNGKTSLKYLYVTGTNLSLEMPECEIFSHETTPDMPIALAVRISSSYPFVFDPVKWNNHLYSDGGLMQNLPTNFDERRFIPAGYDFTEKGVNPGVLAIKVDSQNEINQVLWGIVKEVDLKSAGEVATAVYNALSQNTDTEEIREARMTIALPDNNISSLEFSVDDKGKLDLIGSAELETQNFVENYYRSAYDVKVYKDKVAWLLSLTLDEIDDAIYSYQLMLDGTSDEQEAEKLSTYLKFLNKFLTYKRKLKRDSGCKFEGEVPPFHIDLKPVVRDCGWSKHLEKEMENKLIYIDKQIKYANKRIKSLWYELNGLPPISEQTYLHDIEYFDNVQAITSFQEYYKILKQERREIEIKLGCFEPKETDYSAEQSKKYADLSDVLYPYIMHANTPQILKAVLSSQFPVIKFDSRGYFKKMVFLFDLLQEHDRQCFIIAASYFLKHYKSPNYELFEKIYHQHVSAEIPLPQNMAMLGQVLHTQDANLLVAAYRIEELIRHFEAVCYPEQQPVLTLDMLFNLAPFKTTPKGRTFYSTGSEVEMQHVITSYNIFSKHYQSSRESVAVNRDQPISPDIRKIIFGSLRNENLKEEPSRDDARKSTFF